MKLSPKPEYFFRPQQFFLRLMRTASPDSTRFEALQTPWGASLTVRIKDDIGLALWHLGVYDLIVSESLWRLTDPGDTVADIGANVGYMTSLLAARTGKNGSVIAFEPHPIIGVALEGNCKGWPAHFAPTQIVHAALSNSKGKGELAIPTHFESNRGTAFLTGADNSASVADTIPVSLITGDEYFGELGRPPKVAKIDTEGNEAKVLEGMSQLIAKQQIRDIVFEDHGSYPTKAMVFLEENGYTLFRLKKHFLGPGLERPMTKLPGKLWEPVSYLATADSVRATKKLSSWGWEVLKKRK